MYSLDVIPLTIHRMDIIGSAVSDTMPRFKTPAELNPISTPPNVTSPYLQSLIFRLRSLNSTTLDDVALCLQNARYVADVANHHGKSPRFWDDGIKGTRLVGPLSHQLLSFPRVLESTLHCATYRDEALREMTRLTLLVVLARLKIVFTLVADELVALQERFARIFLLDFSQHPEFPDLQLWALSIVGSTASQGPTRNLYLRQIHKWAGFMQIGCGATAFHLIRQIFLIDGMMAADVRGLLLESICFDQKCCKGNHDPV